MAKKSVQNVGGAGQVNLQAFQLTEKEAELILNYRLCGDYSQESLLWMSGVSARADRMRKENPERVAQIMEELNQDLPRD